MCIQYHIGLPRIASSAEKHKRIFLTLAGASKADLSTMTVCLMAGRSNITWKIHSSGLVKTVVVKDCKCWYSYISWIQLCSPSSEWQSESKTLSGIHNSQVVTLSIYAASLISQPDNSQLEAPEYDSQTPERKIIIFHFGKNVWEQCCFVVRKKNKIDFKCSGRGGHLKETVENRKGFWYNSLKKKTEQRMT